MGGARLAAFFITALIGETWATRSTASEPPGSAASAQTAPRGTATPKADGALRPAVLVLRVWAPQERGGSSRRIEVLEPRGLRRLPYDLRGPADEADDADSSNSGDSRGDNGSLGDLLARDCRDAFNADGSPRLGPGYALVRTYMPDAHRQTVCYYIYHVDLNNPQIARNWRELMRAERQAAREARAELQAEGDWERRKQRLLTEHEQALQEGVVLMQAGEYRPAVIALTRAAELNQGDAACRVHLALARVALGHDAEAARALRRALELQPKLVPMRLGLEQYYPQGADFAAQVDVLRERIRQKFNASPEEYFLLGFMEFQRGQTDEAHAAFRQAARGMPKDERTQKYLALTKPAAP